MGNVRSELDSDKYLLVNVARNIGLLPVLLVFSNSPEEVGVGRLDIVALLIGGGEEALGAVGDDDSSKVLRHTRNRLNGV